MSEAFEKDVKQAEHVENSTDVPALESGGQDRKAESRRRWRSAVIWCVLIGLFLGYMVVVPVVHHVIEARKPVVSVRALEDMSVAESVRLRSAELFGVVWFFAVGASVGSFLNVVAYRMPRGKSIGGSSHCPYCNVRITRRDNVPILGWLMLGGRCRICGQPISSRYLFVEALTGGLFLLLLFVELLSGGANIPFGRDRYYDGFVWIVFYPKWDILGMYAYHMALLCFLVVLALIDWDRLRTPKKLTFAGLLVGSLFPAIWPNLQPVTWWVPRPDWLAPWPWVEHLDTSLAGLIAGVCIGTFLSAAAALRGTSPEERRCIRTRATASMALVGLFLGWQAAISVAAFTALLQLLAAGFGYVWRRIANVPVSGWVLASTALHLCLWRSLSGRPVWPGPHSGPLAISAACAGIIAVCALARLLHSISQANMTVHVPTDEGVLS